MADGAEPVSVASLYALSGLDREEVNRVKAIWPTVPDDRRQTAIRHLVEITEDNFEVDFNSIFRLGLTDQDPEVRSSAVEGLWEDDDPLLIGPLIDMLQSDPHESVRAVAASALARYVLAGELEELPAHKAEPVTTALRRTFARADESIAVRRRALEALGFLSSDEVADLIHQSYYRPDELMRVSAVFAMGRSADAKRWGQLVFEELASANPEMRFEAARASGELEYAPAVQRLTDLVEDTDDEVQRAAVYALGQIGGDKARDILVAILESDAEHLHAIAEEALDELEFKSGNLDFTLMEFDDPDEDDDDWLLDLELDEYDDDTALDD